MYRIRNYGVLTCTIKVTIPIKIVNENLTFSLTIFIFQNYLIRVSNSRPIMCKKYV